MAMNREEKPIATETRRLCAQCGTPLPFAIQLMSPELHPKDGVGTVEFPESYTMVIACGQCHTWSLFKLNRMGAYLSRRPNEEIDGKVSSP